MNAKVVVVLAIVLVALCLSDGECAPRRRRRRQAPCGTAARTCARAVPNGPSSRRFAPGRSRQPPSWGALPRGAALKAQQHHPRRSFALRLGTRVRDAGQRQHRVGQGSLAGRAPGARGSRAESAAAGAGGGASTLAQPVISSARLGFSRGRDSGGPAAPGAGDSCARERFAKSVSHRDARAVAARSGAAAPRPLHARLVLSPHPPERGFAGEPNGAAVGFAPPARRASAQPRGPQRRERTRARVQPASWPLAGVTEEKPRGRRGRSSPPLPPKHTCSLAPLSPAKPSLLPRKERAAEFNRQGLRPLGKVVSCFTGRGGAPFFCPF